MNASVGYGDPRRLRAGEGFADAGKDRFLIEGIDVVSDTFKAEGFGRDGGEDGETV